jgi:hypothetical protein
MSEMLKLVEEYIVSLLGVENRAVPTIWHLQKEFFIFTKMHPKAQKLFNFVKHYEGPYSQILQDSVKEPMYYEDAYVSKGNEAIFLTVQGRKLFCGLKEKYANDEKFTQLLSSLKLIREIYDKLSKDELLFLVYVTYPEFVELSSAYDKIVRSRERRNQLANDLLKKGLITKGRYEELVACVAD